jgi:hypothetical protein
MRYLYDAEVVTLAGDLVLFSGNDERVTSDRRASLIEVAQLLAVRTQPAGLFDLRATLKVIKAAVAKCGANVFYQIELLARLRPQ